MAASFKVSSLNILGENTRFQCSNILSMKSNFPKSLDFNLFASFFGVILKSAPHEITTRSTSGQYSNIKTFG